MSLNDVGGESVNEKDSLAVEHLRHFKETLKQPSPTGTPIVGYGTWHAVIDALLELVDAAKEVAEAAAKV
jgi:hypothetical protein